MGHRWDTPKYQRLRTVEIVSDQIRIGFKNGDIVSIAKEALVPSGFSLLSWGSISFNAYEFIIPAFPYDIIIPWDAIRVLTDIEFSKHMAAKAAEEAKGIGRKVRSLRKGKKLKSKELAERTGLTAQTITRIEKGHTDIHFVTLKKILAAMGYSLRDLVDLDA